jgi:simple sugar transport system permease protein
VLQALAAPALALLAAFILSSAVIAATGKDPFHAFFVMVDFGSKSDSQVWIINKAIPYYLSAVAVAIGFRMNLFNIGVEGQYRVAVFAAAAFTGQNWLPGILNIIVAFLLAIVCGAAWAAIAGVLKVTRGVSEVISTIMLNAIAVSLTAYFLRKWGITVGNALQTKPVPRDSWVPGLDVIPGAPNEVLGLSLLAVLAGVAYAVVLNRSRFGFDLRATGASATAAVASGIDVRRMVVTSMVISGGVAALIGLPILFGDAHSYSTTFQAGLGFSGIAVALLGRNHPIGIAFGALLFAYLTEQSSLLEINAGVSNDIVLITQGVIVLSVVIAYEVVRRYMVAQEQRSVAEQLAPAGSTAEVKA